MRDAWLIVGFVVTPWPSLTTFLVGGIYRHVALSHHWNPQSTEILDKGGARSRRSPKRHCAASNNGNSASLAARRRSSAATACAILPTSAQNSTASSRAATRATQSAFGAGAFRSRVPGRGAH